MIGIIYNPLSRKGQNRYRVEDIKKILDERGIPYVYRETEAPMDGIRVGREVAEECDVVIACGGDGTVNEVVNGAKDSDVTLGILPFGSGNDIARSLGVFSMTDEQLVDIMVNPNPRPMDCGLFEGKAFMLFLAFGVVPNIVKEYMALKKPGRTAYPRAAIKALLHHKPMKYKVVLPDREFECYADLISVQNTPTAGGGLKLCTPAVDNDGHLDLVIIHHRSVGRLILNAIALFTGKIHKQPNYEIIPVTEGDIILGEKRTGVFDGELMEFGDIHFSMTKPVMFLH